MTQTIPREPPAGGPDFWSLDPNVVFLNHGSFGSCPRPVLDYQRRIREHLERQPVRFFVRELESLLDPARVASTCPYTGSTFTPVNRRVVIENILGCSKIHLQNAIATVL